MWGPLWDHFWVLGMAFCVGHLWGPLWSFVGSWHGLLRGPLPYCTHPCLYPQILHILQHFAQFPAQNPRMLYEIQQFVFPKRFYGANPAFCTTIPANTPVSPGQCCSLYNNFANTESGRELNACYLLLLTCSILLVPCYLLPVPVPVPYYQFFTICFCYLSLLPAPAPVPATSSPYLSVPHSLQPVKIHLRNGTYHEP